MTTIIPHTSVASASRGPTVPSWVDRDAFPFQSRFLEVASGHRVHYVDEGEGDPVVFVHGTPTWSFEWRHLIRAFSPSHRCVAIDNLGFGLSDRPLDFGYTPESHSSVLRAFIERLGLTNITLVVHDFGGPIGLPLALDTPGLVRRVVIMNTWMWSFADDPDMARKARIAGGAFGRFLYRYANFSLRVLMPHAFGDRRALTRRIHEQYLAPFRDIDARSRVLWTLARALLGSSAHYDRLWQQRERLAALPALVIWGTRDPAFETPQLARWRSILPRATVVELDVGHWPQEEAPDAVIQAMRSFLTV